MDSATALVWILGAYLLGSVSFALLLVRLLGHADLRAIGSGNLGATNAGRALGRRWGVVVYALDLGKGFLPVLVGQRVLDGAPVGTSSIPVSVLMGGAAYLGHCFPVYTGFRGGKGVATASGVVLAVSWPAFAAAAVAFGIVLAVFRMVSLASLAAALVLPVAYLAVERREAVELPKLAWLSLFLLLAILVVVLHRENIHRIAEGTERRIGGRRS